MAKIFVIPRSEVDVGSVFLRRASTKPMGGRQCPPGVRRAGRGALAPRPRFPESGTWCESSNDTGLRRAEWHKPQPARCFEISPHAGKPGPLPVRRKPAPEEQTARRLTPEKEPPNPSSYKKKRAENRMPRRQLSLRPPA